MSLPQALQLPPVHEALPAPTQQMFDQSRTAAGPGQHDRVHSHNASALSPSLARIHYALHFAASTIPPYRCEKAYLPGPKSNAPNREPASVSVHWSDTLAGSRLGAFDFGPGRYAFSQRYGGIVDAAK